MVKQAKLEDKNVQYIKAYVEEKQEDSFTGVASTEKEDRQGEVVDNAGWNLTNFKKNPILLYMHDHTKPLGKATRVWIDKATGTPRLMFKGMISTATDYGRAAKQLMDEGILNSFSVGFMPMELDGNRITKSELLEISLVSVPANPEARLLAVKSLENAGFDKAVIKDFTVEPIDDESEEEFKISREEFDELRKQLFEVKELANDAVKGLQHLAPHRSKQEVTTKRLASARVLARTADKLLGQSTSPKVAINAKLMKLTSEKLIREMKGDLHGSS
jgi:HK97 family phage prohead protease